MHYLFPCASAILFFACADAPANVATEGSAPSGNTAATVTHYRGAISNGMKGDSIFFDLSADGKQLRNLTFKGYWRCSGRLEQTRVGPDGSFPVANGKAKGHITEPPGGGSTAWRFEIDARIAKKNASGTFRMNINNLGCDTYLLKWTAVTF